MFNKRSILICERDDFFQSPNVIGYSRFHRGRNAQPAEVVVHEVKRGVVFVVSGVAKKFLQLVNFLLSRDAFSRKPINVFQ
jgi:hypothetical protein